jgi:hypothetical protein
MLKITLPTWIIRIRPAFLGSLSASFIAVALPPTLESKKAPLIKLDITNPARAKPISIKKPEVYEMPFELL